MIKQSVDRVYIRCYNQNVNVLLLNGGENMLTNFGKELRKLRIDNDELLKDMASKLGVTVAYLSAVENGNREVPDSWLNILREKYSLDQDSFRELQETAYEKKTGIKLEMNSKEERDVALSFARRFNEMNNEELQELLVFLEKQRKKEE